MQKKAKIGTECRRGRDMTMELAKSIRSRRDFCPKCETTTLQSFELQDQFFAPIYDYRCTGCSCIVEQGDIVQAKRERVARAIEAKPAPRGRAARQL